MKKILVSVCFILLICSVGVFANETESDISGFLETLEITADISDEKAVTRGEFIELLGKALKYDANFIPEEDPFEDVYNYDLISAYLTAMKHNAVVIGAADNNFYPNRNITLSEACAFSVRALNYAYQLKWSASVTEAYVIANNLGILKGIEASSDTLSKAQAQRLIYNMLNAEMLQVDKISEDNISYRTEDGATVLSKFHGISRTDGIVEANDITGLYDVKNAVSDNLISVNGSLFRTENNSMRSLLGERVLIYSDEDSNVIYAFAYKNEYFEIFSEDDPAYSNLTITYNDENKRSKKLAADFKFIYNGAAAVFSNEKLISENGDLFLIDNNNDGAYDVVKVMNWKHMFTGLSNSEEYIAFDRNDAKNKIYSNINGNEHKYETYLFDGTEMQECTFEDYEKNTILRYAASEDGKFITIYGSKLKISGSVSSISTQDVTVIDVNGSQYETSSYFDKYYKENLLFGSEYEFYLDDNYKMVAAVLKTDEMKYGYIIKAKRETGLRDDVLVRMLTSDGIYVSYALNDKMTVDGVSCGRDSTTVNNILFPQSGYPHQVVRYSLNGSGKLFKMDTLTSNSTIEPYTTPENPEDSLYRYFTRENIKYKTSGFFTPKAFVSGATAIFFVPADVGTARDQDFPETKFVVDTTSYFAGDRQYPVDIYDIDKSGYAQAVVVYEDASTKPIKDISGYGVVDKIEDVVSDNGDITKKLYYWTDGAYYNAEFDAAKTSLANDLKCGDMIRLEKNKQGNIVNVSTDFSYERNVTADFGTEDAYVQGKFFKALKIQDQTIFIKNGEAINIYPMNASTQFILYDSEKKRLYSAAAEDIKDIFHYGDAEASSLYARLSYSTIRTILIIK